MADKISIETAYNVTIDYNLANIWDRVWAFLIDSMIKIGYLIFIFLTFSSLIDGMFWLIVLFILPYFFYSLLFEVLNDGQTPGKKAMQLKVVSIDGKNLRFGQLIIRWLLRFLDFLIFSTSIAFLAVVSTKKSQRIGDLAADTTVISLKSQESVEKSSRVKLPEAYVGQYPQVQQLQDSEIELIKEVVRSKSEASNKLRSKMSEKLVHFLDIPKTGNSKEYLKNVVYDYNYFQMIAEGLIEPPAPTMNYISEEE